MAAAQAGDRSAYERLLRDCIPFIEMVARRQSVVTTSIRASSRVSAPKLFTVGFDEIESARAPPIRESIATERSWALRT